jgi:hypothetical protein
VFFEVDYPEVVSSKLEIISNYKIFRDAIGNPDLPNFKKDATKDLHTTNYHLFSVNLTEIDVLEAKLQQSNIDLK